MNTRLLQSDSQDPSRSVARRRAPSNTGSAWSRREVLTLRRSDSQTSAPEVARAGSGPRLAWRVRIDADRCSDCGACVRICKPLALRRSETEQAVSYILDARRCDGCGECARVCARRAVEIRSSTEPAGLHEVACLPFTCCSRCAQRGAGFVDGLCMMCRQPANRLGWEGSCLS